MRKIHDAPTIDRPPSADRRRERLEWARCVTTSAWPVTCEEFTADAEYRFSRHSHAAPHVCFVLEGTLLERDGPRRRRMSAGAGRISPAGDMHDLAIGGGRPLRCLVVAVAPEGFDDPGEAVPDGRRYVAGPAVGELASRLRAELRSLDDTSPLSLEMLALEAAALDGASSRLRVDLAPRWLERVRDRVRDDLRSVPTLAELADDAGVSRAHLARTFRTRYGYTIGQYARRQRLETARRLLLRTDTPLAAVAYEAGFADQSHMTRQIRARFGHPPGRLRRLCRSA